jgi:hypothetical protein
MRNALTWFASSILFIALIACAQGTGGGDDDDTADASAGADAHQFPDSGPLPDAFQFPDAAPLPDAPLPSDAGPGGMCTSSTQCNQGAGECCILVFNICFPEDAGFPCI